MPLPGGPADKFGNRYESWWTVYQLVRVIKGVAEDIRIEDPMVEKAEFIVIAGDHREIHQTKIRHPSGKWSLHSLGCENLLKTIFEQLSAISNTRFVFASSSDAPELKELTRRAKDAKDLKEFESFFVSADTHKKSLRKLREFWKADTAKIYEILQRIVVRTMDEQGIKEQVRDSLQAMFLTKPDDVCDALRSIVADSIHKHIDREQLISALGDRGFRLRKLAKPSDAPSLIAVVTNRYLEVTKKKLIQGSIIPRSSTQELLNKIKKNKSGGDYILIGKAGGGKTGCVIECVEALRKSEKPVAVLAFRLDRIAPVSSTKELGECLGLEESPGFVLATAAEAMLGEAVLIVDQLDFVSTTSGRSPEFFDVVEKLLIEVRGWRNKLKIHIVVVCREFDLNNDHRLRRLLAKEHTHISITDFSSNEVNFVIEDSDFKADLLDAKQLELLRLPQNLSLFLDTSYDLSLKPKFSSKNELFDHYWENKRRAVNNRALPSPDYWNDVINILCAEMTVSQQLSVRKEKLDHFPGDYINQMASEGVLSFDGNRYGFGHESFFDYCFARAFIAQDESLIEFLVKSGQLLFRRAQVRQVLDYLRDDDQERYFRELKALLTDIGIRCHLKDLAVALAVEQPTPDEKVWKVLAPRIKSELAAIKSGSPNPDKFATLVWNRFFSSQYWFQITDKKGLIAEWLMSENDYLVDKGVDYIRCHQNHSGDRVAELLEPFVGRGGGWPQRFNHIMQWADYASSRRFFNLFLRLLDDGTLDDTNDSRGTHNGTFWSMFHRLAKARPDWIAEVTAHWLLRRFSIIREARDNGGTPKWHDLFSHDNSGSDYINDSARKSPDKFAQHVLPVVLKITDETVYKEENSPPRLHAVWSTLSNSEHVSIDNGCSRALAFAVEKLAEEKSDSITGILAELLSRDTYMANFLLLRAYTAGASYFANDAVAELCDKTWRLECGYSDSPHWIAIQLIKAIAPLCSNGNLAMLEKAILSYNPNYKISAKQRTAWINFVSSSLGHAPKYEHIPSRHKFKERAHFSLLSGIPDELRSQKTQTRYAELKRKFETGEPPPQDSRALISLPISSPIKKNSAEEMKDEDWLNIIKEHNSQEIFSWENFEKGGASGLAQTLQERVKEEPDRFACLSLKFPSDTNPVYLEHVLRGLKGTTAATELKLEVCRKGYTEHRDDCGKANADLLGSIEEPLPDDALQMLDWLATEHSDPDKELSSENITGRTPYYYLGRTIEVGISTTRGRAAGAIRDLILRDPSYIERFRTTVERLVKDKSLAVRERVGSTVWVIANHNWEFAIELFFRLIEPRDSQTEDDRLLATQYAERFIKLGLPDHFTRLRWVIERMLSSELPETNVAGARLASLAVLYKHDEADNLVEEAFRGGPSQRIGVAQVASRNIRYEEYRSWSEKQLLRLFNDNDSEVRQEATKCFHSLKGQPPQVYEDLIIKCCDSPAFKEASHFIFSFLEESPHQLPGISYAVCEKYLEQFGDRSNGSNVAKLILRTYHQHQNDEWTSKCLDLIDRMCLERIYGIRSGLDEYER